MAELFVTCSSCKGTGTVGYGYYAENCWTCHGKKVVKVAQALSSAKASGRQKDTMPSEGEQP